MEIRISREGNRAILAPQGELKTADAKLFEKRLLDELAKSDQLTIDFAAVGYICSSGLRALLAAQQAVDDKEDGELILTHVGDEVMSVLKSTGFHNVLTIQ